MVPGGFGAGLVLHAPEVDPVSSKKLIPWKGGSFGREERVCHFGGLRQDGEPKTLPELEKKGWLFDPGLV